MLSKLTDRFSSKKNSTEKHQFIDEANNVIIDSDNEHINNAEKFKLSNNNNNNIESKDSDSDSFKKHLIDDVDYQILDNREYIPEYADEYNPMGLAVATAEDKFNYRLIRTKPTIAAMLILVVEFAERGSYYGVQGILTNFIMRPLPDGSTTGKVLKGHTGNAGALGLGLQDANALVMLLQFLAYVMPLVGGYLADAKLGRFKAIMIGVWVGIISHILFIIAALPPVIAKGQAAMAPTALGIISLAVCTGFIKANLLPLMLDQYPYRQNVLKKLPDGETVYVDRDGSMETLTMIFYWAINIGAFLQIATSYSARDVGYWLAFLCPGIMYLIVVIAMLFIRPNLKPERPKGSLLGKALRVVRVCLKGNFFKRLYNKKFWSYAYPENMEKRGQLYQNKKKQTPIDWTAQEVDDYKSVFTQCVMFSFWVIFNLSDTGLGSTLTAQAGAMTSKGIPNDFFNNFNQIVIVVAIPILDYGLYPLLRKWKINFKPVYKIFVGFMLGATASAVSAILQWRIYKTSPCGYYATDCPEPSPLTAWLAIINYGLCALGECFCYTTAYEIAYTRAPDNAKGLVTALFLFNSAISSAISEGVSGALVDPNLIWPFTGIAAAGGFCAFVFLFCYWNIDKVMAKEEAEREAARQEKDLKPIASIRSETAPFDVNDEFELRSAIQSLH
ncbi:Ptr2 protein [Pichia kluyveri]|uniref:Ptr2 protein n=1 Tax=Pichia kluyveri TaxID=36015 RepID=A0AAV5QWP0_PICKL|nr:Ptr2 protein [Pichia kluyveri]